MNQERAPIKRSFHRNLLSCALKFLKHFVSYPFLCFSTSNHCKQEGLGTLKLPFRWPKSTEISAVLQHSAIEILSILQKKILT